MTLNMTIAMADLIKKFFQLKPWLGGAAGLRSTFLTIRKPIKKQGRTQGPDLSSCALQHADPAFRRLCYRVFVRVRLAGGTRTQATATNTAKPVYTRVNTHAGRS